MNTTRASIVGMKPMVTMLSLLLIAFTAMPAASQQNASAGNTSRLTCPSGYDLIGEVCISRKTGDVVLASRK